METTKEEEEDSNLESGMRTILSKQKSPHGPYSLHQSSMDCNMGFNPTNSAGVIINITALESDECNANNESDGEVPIVKKTMTRHCPICKKNLLKRGMVNHMLRIHKVYVGSAPSEDIS